jgi:hypothetical protein
MKVNPMKLNFDTAKTLAFFATRIGKWWFILIKDDQTQKSPKRKRA